MLDAKHILVACALLSGCHTQPEKRYLCWDMSGDIPLAMKATAFRGPTGAIFYEAIDRKGDALQISATNSARYRCHQTGVPKP